MDKDRLKKIFAPFIDFVYPNLCLFCDELLENHSTRLCNSCWQSIKTLSLSHRLNVEILNRLSTNGLIQDVVSLYVFEPDGALQSLIHSLKYKGFRSIGRELGAKLGVEIQRREITADIIIPVPLYRPRKRERGYNQAEVIAEGVSKQTGVQQNSKCVYRTRDTKTQTNLNIQERNANVEDAFAVEMQFKRYLSEKSAIVIDDVMTTGATMGAVCEALKSSGVKKIIAASIALAE